MKSNPVVHFEIYVQDMERAKTFYEGVLAIKLDIIIESSILQLLYYYIFFARPYS